MIDKIGIVVENRFALGPITLFLGAKRAFFGERMLKVKEKGYERKSL